MQFKSSWLLIFSWMVGLIGLLLGLFVEPIWFARFGSLIVLLGAMSEYTLLHNELDVLYRRLDNLDVGDDIPDLSPSKWYKKKVLWSHFTVILGTLIWGFGDLLL